MIKREHTLVWVLTPEEIASEFAGMNDSEQAIFFSELARITGEWNRPFCFQLQSLVDRPELSIEGRRIMEEIGEYARLSRAELKVKREAEKKRRRRK